MCDTGDDCGTPVDELAGLLAAIERLRARARDGRSPDHIGEELVALRHAGNILELEFSVTAAEFAATEEYDLQGSVSPISWIRHHCNMTGHAAAGAVCVGEQLPTLPQSAQALGEGRIGFAHLALLAGTARSLGESPTAGAFDEGPLLRQAMEHSVSRFRDDCTHARHAADARMFLAEHVEAVEARRLELIPCESGALVIRGILDPVGGATLSTALEPLAKAGGVGDNRGRKRRFADALVELADHSLDHCTVPGATQRPHLQVTTSLETLMGLTGAPAGELDSSTPIPAATVQRLACDSAVRRILLGPASAVIDVGRARRVPAPATRLALRLRDGGCAWPKCERPATWTEVHHILHWAQGGVTELPNLVQVCKKHHWKCHEGGWDLVLTVAGVLAIPPRRAFMPPARAPDATRAA